jgi:hypothetical protein
MIVTEQAAAKIAANKKSPCESARPQPPAAIREIPTSSRRPASTHGGFISRPIVPGAAHITDTHSGHNIMIDNAAVVVRAIRMVVDAVRAGQISVKRIDAHWSTDVRFANRPC